MESAYAVLAALVVAVHLAFVGFAAAGSVLVLRRPALAWLHLPAVAWAVFIELSGGICPLTPLENAFRQKAGLDLYAGDFVARYVFPVLYPAGLTRRTQVLIGVSLLVVNAAAYAWLLRRRLRRARPAGGVTPASPRHGPTSD